MYSVIKLLLKCIVEQPFIPHLKLSLHPFLKCIAPIYCRHEWDDIQMDLYFRNLLWIVESIISSQTGLEDKLQALGILINLLELFIAFPSVVLASTRSTQYRLCELEDGWGLDSRAIHTAILSVNSLKI